MAPDDDFESLGEVFRKSGFRAELERLAAAVAADPMPDADPLPSCARCRGAGLLRRDVDSGHPEFGRPIECPCGLVAARRQLRIWEASQIPPKYQRYTLDGFAALTGKHALVEQLRRWEQGERWLVLVGGVGVGKSGLAASLLVAWLRRGQSGLYVSAPLFFSRIRATYGSSSEGDDELAVLASLGEVGLLVLDDIGTVRLSEWGQEKLYTVLNDRFVLGRRTILTSNLLVEDRSLEAYLWPSTWDRIRGMSDVFTLTGESLR